jgi:hypothetical protein
MIATQLIPNSWVAGNVKKSQEIIRAESIYHDAYHVPQTHWLAGSDGYSDNIFIEQQIADRSHGVIYGAMMPSYDRYWHGYSIFLRPLLVFFDLSHIRQLLVICFIVTLVVLAHLIAKYISLVVAVIFGIALALVNPPIIMISLQYSNMFLLMLAASIVLLLLLAKKRPKHEIFIFFAAVGSLTSFFDLLTTPAITLGIPLLLYVAYRIKNQDKKNLLKDVVICASIWGAGYLVTWFAKWMIGSLVLNRNIFQEATQKIAFWSSDSSTITNKNVGVWSVFMEWGARLIVYWPLLGLAGLGLVLTLTSKLLSFLRKKSSNLHLSSILALLIPSLIPIAWIVLARQHSFNHQWFSYRHLIILIFGLLLIIWYINRTQSDLSYRSVAINLYKKPVHYLRTLRAKF